MSKITVSIKELRDYLTKKNNEDLIEEIVLLVKTFPQVEEYYQVKLCPAGEAQVLLKCKKMISNELFPSRGLGKLQLSNVNKAFSSYKKVSKSVEGRIDLLLYFIEECVDFINEFGDTAENFYDKMESSYEEACKLLSSKDLKKKWKPRFEKIVEASENFGYGIGDNFEDYFEKTFKNL